MKLLNFFKKESAVKSASKIQSLDKSMLSKVIGGGDGDVPVDPISTDTTIVKSKSNIKNT